MGSLIEELQRREAAARREADELRSEIGRLSERLARAEETLARLEVTRETVTEILGGAGTGQEAAGQAAGAAGPVPADSRLVSPPIGVVKVPPWRPGLAQSVLPPSCQDLLEVLADAALSLPAGRHSHGLRRLAVCEAVRGSCDTATAAISARCGRVAGKRQLEELVKAAAADIDGFYAQRVPVPCTSEVLLVLSADSKGIVMRPEGLRPATRKAAACKKQGRGVFRTRLASGEKTCRKRMATLACVYDTAPASRRPHDVIAVPGGRTGEREIRRGPHAEAKWLAGSAARGADEVIAAAFSQAGARDPAHARTWVALVDGDRHQIGLIEAEAARRKATVHLVIDLVHVLEYLWAAAWCFHARDDPAAEDRVAVQALAVLAGRVRQVTRSLTAQAAQHGLTESQRAGVEACARYLTNNKEYLRYDQALASGWPIATGVIEGAARHLIGDRLDITGSRWGIEGAEAILRLRAVIDNGDFEAYWAFHLHREHDRVHQAHDQDRYHLVA